MAGTAASYSSFSVDSSLEEP
uniref:Uncharacterized protein n=1 Tax=Arundo donax TaxID=35708 RepID=A0A0A9GMA0_ARUDO